VILRPKTHSSLLADNTGAESAQHQQLTVSRPTSVVSSAEWVRHPGPFTDVLAILPAYKTDIARFVPAGGDDS